MKYRLTILQINKFFQYLYTVSLIHLYLTFVKTARNEYWNETSRRCKSGISLLYTDCIYNTPGKLNLEQTFHLQELPWQPVDMTKPRRIHTYHLVTSVSARLEPIIPKLYTVHKTEHHLISRPNTEHEGGRRLHRDLNWRSPLSSRSTMVTGQCLISKWM